MINTIKEFIFNGMMTLKSLLTFEWINFKNWKEWTSLRNVILHDYYVYGNRYDIWVFWRRNMVCDVFRYLLFL